MSLFDRFRKQSKADASEPQQRALPRPARVDLGDILTHDAHFERLLEWAYYGATRPSWEIPSEAEMQERVEAMIDEHAAKGTLDGLVPDLLDRLIQARIDEVKAKVRETHEQALLQLGRFQEQAVVARTEVTEKLAEVHHRQMLAQDEYRDAWEQLTGRSWDDVLAAPGPRDDNELDQQRHRHDDSPDGFVRRG